MRSTSIRQQRSWCLVVSIGVALAAGGCACRPETPNSADLLVNQELMREYVAAVVSGDPESIRPLAGYIRMDSSDTSDDLVVGDALPLSCLLREIEVLTAAGVTIASEVEVMSIGGDSVEVDDSDGSIDFGMEVGQIGLFDGSTVGRGIIPLVGGSVVQIEPSDECDDELLRVS